MASMSAVITTILNYFAYWCQDWSWKLPKRLLRTAAELLRITAHRRTPRLPPIAMVASFVSFTVAYSWSCKRLLRPTRFLRCYSLSCTVAYFSLCGCLFLAPTAPLHVLGLNAYISWPFGHPS